MTDETRTGSAVAELDADALRAEAEAALAAAVDEKGKLDPRKLDPKIANVLYHDKAADDYDEKWSIQYDERTLAYAEDRVFKVLPERRTFDRALEVGSGTGFFLLHLWKGGWIREGAATDISPGILEACARNARNMGWEVDTKVADAESLPFPDDSFDLVLGHAFLHHIPDPGQCVREMVRVCRPGGTVLIAGEPTKGGHAIAEVVKKTVSTSVKLFRRTPVGWALGWRPKDRSEEEAEIAALESVVDLWEFEPEHVAGMFEGAGLTDVRYATEELASSVFGWTCRTLEGMAPDGALGARWAFFAYRNYLRLADLDENVLTDRLPKRWFYNIVIAGEKPAASTSEA